MTHFHQLEHAIATATDLAKVRAEVLAAMDADRITSVQARQLLAAIHQRTGKAQQRRRAEAAERLRLAEEFERTVPALDGVEAPYEPQRDEDGNWRDGW